MQSDREGILHHCTRLLPSLAGAEPLSGWVGLRPSRTSVRMELGTVAAGMAAASAPATPHVLHSYGYRGSGLTLAWGCAGDAVSNCGQC